MGRDLVSSLATRRAAKRTGQEVAAALAAGDTAGQRADDLLRRTYDMLRDASIDPDGKVPSSTSSRLMAEIYDHLLAQALRR